jgi:hypothetical protein
MNRFLKAELQAHGHLTGSEYKGANKMSKFSKSKVGWFLAGIHLLTVFSCLLYVNLIDKSSVLPVLILMILTAPWGFLFMVLLTQLGIATGEIASHKNDDLFFNVGMALGALVNAFILYLLGFLVTKAFKYLSSK